MQAVISNRNAQTIILKLRSKTQKVWLKHADDDIQHILDCCNSCFSGISCCYPHLFSNVLYAVLNLALRCYPTPLYSCVQTYFQPHYPSFRPSNPSRTWDSSFVHTLCYSGRFVLIKEELVKYGCVHPWKSFKRLLGFVVLEILYWDFFISDTDRWVSNQFWCSFTWLSPFLFEILIFSDNSTAGSCGSQSGTSELKGISSFTSLLTIIHLLTSWSYFALQHSCSPLLSDCGSGLQELLRIPCYKKETAKRI